MKPILIIGAVVTGLLLFSVVICGLWLRYSGKPVDESSLRFHMLLGLITAAASLITMVLGIAVAA